MIYEIRTYNLKPGAVGEYESQFAKAYQVRQKYSKLYGFWHTDVGPLNQLVHIWGYDNMQHRADVRAAAAKDPDARPQGTQDLVISQESDILTPIKGMKEWEGDNALGGLYELRMYTFPGGEVGKVAEKFAEAYEGRANLYPIAGIWTSELGTLNRLYQLFPFKDWKHRDEIRVQFRQTGVWPPRTDGHPLHQLVRHMVPAAYSPLH